MANDIVKKQHVTQLILNATEPFCGPLHMLIVLI